MENGEGLASLSVSSHGFTFLLILLLHDDLYLADVKIGFITSMGGEEHFEGFAKNTVTLILDVADLEKFRVPRHRRRELKSTGKRIPKGRASEDRGISKIGSILLRSQKSDAFLNGSGEGSGVVLTKTVKQRKEERISGMKRSIGGTNE